MKMDKNYGISGAVALWGAAAAVLRVVLLKTGLDEKGLLVAGSPANYALWVLTIGFLAAMAVVVWKLESGGKFRDYFPRCVLRGGLGVLGGALLAAESIRQVLAAQYLTGILGLAAGVCMVFTGLCRWKGRHPGPAFHCIVCVFFVIRLIVSFQGWSADPQFQDYSLQMLSCVSLMLFAFHRASCDANIINRPRTAFFGLCAVYFCIASVSDETMPLFYIAAGLWAAGAGCDLCRQPREA